MLPVRSFVTKGKPTSGGAGAHLAKAAVEIGRAAVVTIAPMKTESPTAIPPAQKLLVSRILCGAFLGSIATYGVVVGVIAKTGDAPAPMAVTLRYALLAVGIIAPLSGWVITAQMPLPRDAAEDPGGHKLATALMLRTILRLATAEAPAIIGLALFLLGRRLEDFAILSVVSFVAIAASFPRRADWESRAREVGVNMPLN